MLVNLGFQHDWMKNYQTKIPDMLAAGIQVLIYAGDVDFICNWLGNKHWALALEWPRWQTLQGEGGFPPLHFA